MDHPKVPAGLKCVDCHKTDEFGSTPRSTLLLKPNLVPTPKPRAPSARACDEVYCLVNPGESCCLPTPPLVLEKTEAALAITASSPSLIYMDGKKLGTTPLRKKVRAGKHKLRVVPIDGGRPSHRLIDLEPGDRMKLAL
jgi:hypothetical protein